MASGASMSLTSLTASVSIQQTPPGNPKFVKLDQKYVCPICNEVLRDPVQTPCGHRFCENCANNLFTNDPDQKVKCPANEPDCEDFQKSQVYYKYKDFNIFDFNYRVYLQVHFICCC